MSEYITETFGSANGGTYTWQREEIVRCKNCKFFATDKLDDYCTMFDFEDVKGMGDRFCAWGEGGRMSEYNRYVDATYERYDVEISYTCPKCGQKWFCSIESGDVYWMQEAGLDVICDKCGAKFLVWEK